ncbi:MAG: agmatine deiminase family protein [Gammaproteobacteria bacterium]|nr:agmatine deiminase family protein [Gammaproteobacteria bacterium]MCI0590015.1 agmatine deiminase family protein [Gammaproteobacteria bacterium]
MTWPHPESNWQQEPLAAESAFVAIAKAVSDSQKLVIACNDEEHRDHVDTLLRQAQIKVNRHRLYVAPSNDSWARDHGPIGVLEDGNALLLDFEFNGWGNKYPADRDNLITQTLHAAGAFGHTPVESIDFVLEGGSIETDGAGTLLTTRRCLLSPTRNPNLTPKQIESQLLERLSCRRILWLNNGQLLGDDTDGHIDTLARFVDRESIAHLQCNDEDDPNYPELDAMVRELHVLQRLDGEPYRLVPLPCPRLIRSNDGEPLPATYANFLILNDAVLVPTYEDPADALALKILADCFPLRQTIGVNALPLIHEYGSLHCVATHLPRGVVQ